MPVGIFAERRPAKPLDGMLCTNERVRGETADTIFSRVPAARRPRSSLADVPADLATEQLFGLVRGHEFPKRAEFMQLSADLNADRLIDPADI